MTTSHFCRALLYGSLLLPSAAFSRAPDPPPDPQALIATANAEGLPTAGLQLKLEEGLAKRIPAARIGGVLASDLDALRTAQRAVPDLPAATLEAAGRAVGAGASPESVRRLGSGVPARTFDALADLMRAGFPEASAVDLVQTAAAAADPEVSLHGLATAASALIRDGARPVDVASRLEGAMARGRSPLTALPNLPSVVPDGAGSGNGNGKGKGYGKAKAQAPGNGGGPGNGNNP